MSAFIDLKGRKFNKLLVLAHHDIAQRGHRWVCQCDCGNETVAYGVDLRTEKKTSCGCLRWKGTPTHRMSKTRIYATWSNMKRRCNDPTNKEYMNYGGRGISYCTEWERFEKFYEDMSGGYSDNLTIDRIDNNKGYSKDNCRWAGKMVQANNTSANRWVNYKGELITLSDFCRKTGAEYWLVGKNVRQGKSLLEAVKKKEKEKIEYKGEVKTVSEFAKEHGFTYHQLKKRLMKGWTVEKAIECPPCKNQYTYTAFSDLKDAHKKYATG